MPAPDDIELPSSKLSAEAASFVPKLESSVAPPNQLENLPRYLTSCYPFVQGDPGTCRAPADLLSGPLQGMEVNSIRFPATSSAGPGHISPRVPGPRGSGGYGIRHPGKPHGGRPFVPNRPFLGPSPAPPQQSLMYGHPHQFMPPAAYMPQTSPFHYGPPQALWPCAPPEYTAALQAAYCASAAPYFRDSWPGSMGPAKSQNDRRHQAGGRRRKDSHNMVSVGIQNEPGVLANDAIPKRKIRTKTLILVDCSIQTDFHDDIANVPLAVKPNSLYKQTMQRDWWRNIPRSSSESDKDSDSGYSSPLHRRNQTSNGTHPAVLFTGMSHAPPLLTTARPRFVRAGGGDDDRGGRKRKPSRPRSRITNHDNPGGKDLKNGGPPKQTIVPEANLHFEDEEEFPNLLSAVNNLHVTSTAVTAPGGPPRSYSDMLKAAAPVRPPPQTRHSPSQQASGSSPSAGNPDAKRSADGSRDNLSRKRRRRREQASQAADAELAEISLEQQVLKELSMKQVRPPAPPPPAGGKKSKQSHTLNFAAMIEALEKQQLDGQQKNSGEKIIISTSPKKLPFRTPLAAAPDKPAVVQKTTGAAANPLDSSAPTVKRGKEREVPKAKKPSSLKKVILKEREEKKRIQLFDGQVETTPTDEQSDEVCPGQQAESDLSQEVGPPQEAPLEIGVVSEDMSPISQTSPFSMSPLSPGSPLSSGVGSPVAGNVGEQKPSVSVKIHSRRFRE